MLYMCNINVCKIFKSNCDSVHLVFVIRALRPLVCYQVFGKRNFFCAPTMVSMLSGSIANFLKPFISGTACIQSMLHLLIEKKKKLSVLTIDFFFTLVDNS